MSASEYLTDIVMKLITDTDTLSMLGKKYRLRQFFLPSRARAFLSRIRNRIAGRRRSFEIITKTHYFSAVAVTQRPHMPLHPFPKPVLHPHLDRKIIRVRRAALQYTVKLFEV